MNQKLEVRDLQISFRTQNGTLKAVRGIDFSLKKGETLAIVGESGSGKSVTAKAILGILSRNSIIESGEIIYEGQDLLKLTQDEFDELRGNRISMIYQDPLSSLDPIMRIGKQMTEAALVNGKINRKRSRKLFNGKINALSKAMRAAGIEEAEAVKVIKELSELIPAACTYRTAYARAREYAEAAIFSCDQLSIAVRKKDKALINEELGYLRERLEKAGNPLLLPDESRVQKLAEGLPDTAAELKDLLTEAVERKESDYPALAFAESLGQLPERAAEDMAAWNEALHSKAWQEAYQEIYSAVYRALRHSNELYREKRQEARELAERYLPLFEQEELNIRACKKAVREMSKAVNASINPLNVTKSASAATFAGTMKHSLERYTEGVPGNKKEERRVKQDTEKYERLMKQKGDAPRVIPPMLVNLELTRKTMLRAMTNLLEEYSETEITEEWLKAETSHMLEWLEEQGNAMVKKVSKQYAYDSAIRIMEEVGITEPRKRFEQYPFEFSGGMRQRIVIGIAIAANPDILICDEPTTALDVTIQSQILELINNLKRKHHLTVIFITHDLGVVANMADKVGVMYAGKLVEYGMAEDIFYEPAHPYTWALLSSMPDLDTTERLEAIPGTPPNMIYPPKGDAFAARNKYAMAIDFEKEPPRFELSETHWAATWLLHPKAPKVEIPRIVTERIARMKKLEEEALKNEQK